MTTGKGWREHNYMYVLISKKHTGTSMTEVATCLT